MGYLGAIRPHQHFDATIFKLEILVSLSVFPVLNSAPSGAEHKDPGDGSDTAQPLTSSQLGWGDNHVPIAGRMFFKKKPAQIALGECHLLEGL